MRRRATATRVLLARIDPREGVPQEAPQEHEEGTRQNSEEAVLKEEARQSNSVAKCCRKEGVLNITVTI